MLPNGARFWYKGDDGLWWLGKISASMTTDGVYLVRCLDDPGPIKLSFSGELLDFDGSCTRSLVSTKTLC